MKALQSIIPGLLFTVLSLVSCGGGAADSTEASANIKSADSKSAVDHSKAPRTGTRDGKHNGNRAPYIVIDRYCNRVLLRTDEKVLLEADCSTGSGGELVDSTTGRKWKFDTPTGIFTVSSMKANPWWRKPDWAYIEEGTEPPESNSERLDANMMGDYAIGFGDGYFIHGTIYERLIGASVTHGCVRMEAEPLKKLFNRTSMGTKVYVY